MWHFSTQWRGLTTQELARDSSKNERIASFERIVITRVGAGVAAVSLIGENTIATVRVKKHAARLPAFEGEGRGGDGN
jgi:hypothetical protein